MDTRTWVPFSLAFFFAAFLLAFASAQASAQAQTSAPAAPPEVTIESPYGGFVNTPIITVSGRVRNAGEEFALLLYNGIAQRIVIGPDGNFSTRIMVSYGDTLIEVRARNDEGWGIERRSFFANVAKTAMKVVLVSDSNRTIMDLWVTGPDGEKIYWANQTGKGGGQLGIGTYGYGPQTFTHAAPQAGSWNIQIHNWSSRGAPLTTMRVYLVLFEGTDREERQTWDLVSFRAGDVVNVASFVIDGEGRIAERQ